MAATKTHFGLVKENLSSVRETEANVAQFFASKFVFFIRLIIASSGSLLRKGAKVFNGIFRGGGESWKGRQVGRQYLHPRGGIKVLRIRQRGGKRGHVRNHFSRLILNSFPTDKRWIIRKRVSQKLERMLGRFQNHHGHKFFFLLFLFCESDNVISFLPLLIFQWLWVQNILQRNKYLGYVNQDSMGLFKIGRRSKATSFRRCVKSEDATDGNENTIQCYLKQNIGIARSCLFAFRFFPEPEPG
jgi:hypothetical protein